MAPPDRSLRLRELLALAGALAAAVVWLGPRALEAEPSTRAEAFERRAALRYLVEEQVPRLRLDGWHDGIGFGRPVRGEPLPLLGTTLLASLLPSTTAAIRVGDLLGLLLLPLLAYVALRLLGYGISGGALGGAAALWVLFVAAPAVAPATSPSETSTAIAGTALASCGLAALVGWHARGRGPWLPAGLLAAAALTSPPAALWAGLSGSFTVCASREPRRTLGWLAAAWSLALAAAAFSLLPRLADHGWDDPCSLCAAGAEAVRPAIPQLWLLLAATPLLLVTARWESRRLWSADPRPLSLVYAAAVAIALGVTGAWGGTDLPSLRAALLGLALGAAALLAGHLPAHAVTRRGLVAALCLGSAASALSSEALHAWLDGSTTTTAFELEEGERVLVEERDGVAWRAAGAGAILRGVDDGVPPFPSAAEASATCESPLHSLKPLARGDADAVDRLRRAGVGRVAATSPALVAALAARDDLVETSREPPVRVFALRGGAPRVAPLAVAPVRSERAGWRDKARRWTTRRPLSQAVLVFADAPVVPLDEPNEWLAPPAEPLEGPVSVEESVAPGAIAIRTAEPGHPLIVRVPYHPRWRVAGGDGPHLATPCFMLVIPRQQELRLSFARSRLEWVGLFAALAAAALCSLGAQRRLAPAAPAEIAAAGSLPWSALVPGALLLVHVMLQLAAVPRVDASTSEPLADRALSAFGEKRYADAAEYARHALARSDALRDPMLILRGDSLLRLGREREAAVAYDAVLRTGVGPYQAQALFGSATAHAAAGDAERARAARDRLLREFPGTPWARLVGEAPP